uniref:BZIP domain-containing protein n=1 Tax=Monopterus albus TaxID=43700 RepID=A0A3Q3IAA4_MONAL
MQIAKKYFTEGLIQLTILLSLIGVRVDFDSYLSGYYTPLIEINSGPSSAYIQTPFHILRDTLDGYGVHPKCPELDHFFASRRLLDEVRTLGSLRFPTQLNAWLVHEVSASNKDDSGPSTTTTTNSTDTSSGLESNRDEPRDDSELLLLEGIAALSDPADHPPTPNIDQHWNSLLSLSDLDSLVMDTDITSAISQDVSLHDALVAFGVVTERAEARPLTQQQRTLFQQESTGLSHSDASPGMALSLAALPFVSLCNLTGNVSSHSAMGGCLDEAVFDQINQLGLEGMDAIDNQLMDSLQNLDSQLLEDLDSDSGLSLESSSDMSSSSSSYCEDECGATGYSSEVDSVASKGIMDYTTALSPVDLSESVWHDHSYSSPNFLNQPSVTLPHKGIKEEPLSDDDGPRFEERELSRDELRARAMCIPFSVLQIVNMPVEEFLEVLDGQGLSPEQVTLLRDIRRRGKNKLAAQNCRKRKLDAITGLEEEVERLQAQRDRLLREKQLKVKTMGAVGQQIEQLTRDVLAQLRDESGQPLNPERFTLQCGANGRVVVQPIRRPAVATSTGNKTVKRKKEKKQ